MRLFPAGVCVVGADADGDRVAVTVGSLVSLSLEPPLVGISIGRADALHELLAEAGAFGVSHPPRRPGGGRRPFRARRAADRPLGRRRDAGRRTGAPLLADALGWIECRSGRARDRRPHLLRRRGRRARGGRAGPRPRLSRARLPRRLMTVYTCITAVVFDMDGVLIDSEQLWDEVREQLARERGGRWHDARAGGHDGNELAGVVAVHARRDRAAPSRRRRSTPRSCGGCSRVTASRCRSARRSRGRRATGAQWPLGLASSSNREVIDAVLELAGIARLLPRDRLLGGGRARQAGARRLPRGGAAARRRAGRLRRRRGLAQRHPLGARRRACASSRSRTRTTRRARTRSRSPTSSCARSTS